MAYFEPNSTIKIMKGVPLDPSYDHTIYWTTEQAREDYFGTKTKYTLTRQMYQRVNKGRMRILKRAEDLYDCNYLAFQSKLDASGLSVPKWFYCFITGVEYINNEVTEITYSIDVMTTYHFDYTLGQCFVEREHSATDAIGDNLVPENLDIGELIASDTYLYRPSVFENLDLVYWLSRDGLTRPRGYSDPLTRSVGGYRPKCYPYIRNGVYQTASVADAINWYYNAPTTTADIVSIVPSYWVENWNAGYGENGNVQNYNDTFLTEYIPIGYSMTKSDGTTIKNKKCFTYPYYVLQASNNQGISQTYKLEWCKIVTINGNRYVAFSVNGEVAPQCSVVMAPAGYLNSASDFLVYDYSISTTFNIFVSVNEDIFKIWLGQRASGAMLPAAFAGEQAIELYQKREWSSPKHFEGSAKHFKSHPKHFDKEDWSEYSTDSMMGEGGWIGVVSSLASSAQTLLTGTGGLPGNQGSFSLMSSVEGGVPCSINFVVRHLTPEYATIIDDYFTKYGYACHKLKVPNRDARPQFNYVKTIDCLIEAVDTADHGMPADDEAVICDIYNKGITFWKNPANIGNYSVSNAPVSS